MNIFLDPNGVLVYIDYNSIAFNYQMSLEPYNVERGLTLSKINQKAPKHLIEQIIRDHIKEIDVKIKAAVNTGNIGIEYELPVNFVDLRDKLSKKDAQILIWSEILRLLVTSEADGGKGFDNAVIDISPNGDKAVIYVKWQHVIDDEERRIRTNYIKGHSTNPKK